MAIVINGSGTVTGLSVGGLPDGTVDEGTLATDSVTTTKIPAALENTFVSGRKNMIINGAMQVAQRGTSSTSDGYATVDRFFTYKENTDQLTITQLQHDTVPDGFGASWKIDVGTQETAIEANDLYQITTRLEGQDLQHLKYGTSSAQSTTLSFWVYASKTGTYVVHLYNRDSGRDITATYTINTINTWEHKTMTFAGDTVSGFDNDANRSLDIQWQLMAGSNFTGTASTSWGALADPRTANGQNTTWGTNASDTFYITGIQWEVGSVATDFEHRNYGEELALCQRYFQFFVDGAGYFAGNGVGSNRIDCGLPLAVPLRASPSFTSNDYTTHRSGNGNSSTNQITAGEYHANSTMLKLRCGGHSVSDETAYNVRINSENLLVDAEL